MVEDIWLIDEQTGEKIVYIQCIDNQALEQLAHLLHADIADADQFRKENEA